MNHHRRVILSLVASFALCGSVALAVADESSDGPEHFDERLHYQISWMGIHCGRMTLESYREPGDEDTFHYVVMTARSSSFFDGIYKVRGRIESTYSVTRGSSIRYHDVRQEKKKHSDDLYEIDWTDGSIKHTSGGEIERIPLDADRVLDPLAYLYRLRQVVGEPGQRIPLILVTSDGAENTVAEVVEFKSIKTPFGKRDAVRVVPTASSEELKKKGRLGIWIGADDRATPYRLVADLTFGKLVARLIEIERTDPESGETTRIVGATTAES
jgi:hypothetical protein